MVKADATRQKFQMRFELPNCNRVVNDDAMITNCGQIMFESHCVNGAYMQFLVTWRQVCLPFLRLLLRSYHRWINNTDKNLSL